MPDSDPSRNTSHSDQQSQKPPPRSSSPAKRLHSDMDDTSNMDVDSSGSARRGSGQSSPRATKPLPAATTSQRSLRATSVEMTDAVSNGGSAAGSETTLGSNADSSATSVSQPTNAPSVDEQVGKVLALTNRPLQDRQAGYVISEKWLERVFARSSEYKSRPEQFDKSATVGPIGPVDNSDLVDTDLASEGLVDQNGEEFIPLRPGQMLQQHFEMLPVEAWELVMGWYGLKPGSPVIRRYVHNTSANEFNENLQWELYPLIFTVRKVKKSESNTNLAKRIVTSRSDNFVDFVKAAKHAAGIDSNVKVRVWRVLNTAPTDVSPPQPSGMLTPESSPRNGSPVSVPPRQRPSLIIDSAAFLALTEGTEREQVTGKDEKENEHSNDQLTVHDAGLGEDQVIILEEFENGTYFSDSASKAVASAKAGTKLTKGLQSAANSGRSTPTPAGPMTRGRTRTGKTRGTVGLTNLGNTCYMNSALQCIRSVEELSIYFLQQQWKTELNTDNPLGHNGAIASVYASLLASIYDVNGVSSFAPKNFKNTLGRCQPIFSGYGQQDSQEFLSFLVDGLHEDLNRIHKKPYIENPESDDDTHKDPEAIKVLGEKFRAIHRSRNDSIAMDLFNGFYKNTMVCPECGKVSITFDPYSLLTLQLPIEQTWQHPITFVPLRGQLWSMEVDISKNATVKELKEYIGRRFGVKWNRLMISEVYQSKYYRHLEDKKTIAECGIQTRDDIFAYELDQVPSNWPPPKKKRSMFTYASSDEDIPDNSSAEHDRVMIPIFHRKPSTSSYRSSAYAMALFPSFIVLTRDEAKDYDTIFKKVLAKVAQATTREIFGESSSSSNDVSGSGSDTVLTTEDDASPNGDPRIQDGSVNGEDMVEVTMTDSVEQKTTESDGDNVPEILRPGAFIPQEYRQLFDIKHTRSGKEYVTTGWSTVDASKNFMNIEKRIPVPSSRESSAQPSEAGSNNSSTEEADDAPQFSADAMDTQGAIDAVNQSSDEEMQTIETTTSFSRGGRQNNKKKTKKQRRQDKKHRHNKNLKTYSKKGKVPEQPSQSFEDVGANEDGTLIRMGEGLVVDWNQEAFDGLFGAINEEDSRGMEATKMIETLEDEELNAKKAKRAARRKHGITLDECFAETSKSEVLSEDNAWYCNRCKDMRRATKTLELWTAPDILVVHLKRFSAHRAFRDKIEALVDFPIEGLDLSDKVGLPEGKELVYDLFAVDNHYGGLGGGHYTAYAQNFFDKQWYEYNDAMVSKRSNPEAVVTSSAYLLFYRRRSANPLGPPKLQQLINDAKHPGSELSENSDEDENGREQSASGNGLRLGDSSRNGSSSAFGAAAGVDRLHGAGSAAAGSLALKGAGAETRVDELLPGYEDEGYADEEDDRNFNPVDNTSPIYGPVWSFDNIRKPNQNTGADGIFDDYDDDDNVSVAPNMGSDAGDNDASMRMIEEFNEDISASGIAPGTSTPQDDQVPELMGVEVAEAKDPPVAEIHVKSD